MIERKSDSEGNVAYDECHVDEVKIAEGHETTPLAGFPHDRLEDKLPQDTILELEPAVVNPRGGWMCMHMGFVPMKEGIWISQRDLHRWHVLRVVLEETVTLLEAARVLGVSYRHAKRLRKSAKEGSLPGILHGSRGRVRQIRQMQP